MLLIVSVIVSAVVGTGIGGVISERASTLVCRIGGGTDCGEPREPPPSMAVKPPPESPTVGKGPAIGEGEDIVVLPFPGSVAVKCSVSSRSKKRCKSGTSTGVDVGLRSEVSISRTGTRVNAKGCPTVTLSSRAKLEVVAGGKAKGKNVSVSGEVYGGKAIKYDVTVTPDRAEAMEGDKAPPNPVDPRTLERGESIQMSEEFYKGAGMSAEYRAIRASFSNDKGRRISTAVSRIDDSTVRVYAGDEDFVREATSLGVGVKGAKLSFGGTSELADGRLSAIDIDVSTPEGWATYQRFVQSGRLPREGDRGASDPTDARRVKVSDAAKLNVELGPGSFSFEGSSSDGSRTETRNADGSVDTVATARYNGVSVTMTSSADPDGEPTGKPTYRVTANNVDDSLVSTFQTVNGEPGDVRGGTVSLELTEADLRRLSTQAVRQIQRQYEQQGDDPPSAAEVRRQVREKGFVENDDGLQIAVTDPLVAALAGAKTPGQALQAFLYAPGFGSANSLVDGLTKFAQANQRAYNDGSSGSDLEVDPEARVPGVLGTPDCG